jgi:hypothetical protein
MISIPRLNRTTEEKGCVCDHSDRIVMDTAVCSRMRGVTVRGANAFVETNNVTSLQ